MAVNTPISQGDASNWDASIYASENDHLRHSIGNLTLLPARENSSAGNESWEKKKLYYKAFSKLSQEDREAVFAEASEKGMVFKKSTQELIRDGYVLSAVQGIGETNDWTKGLIEERTDNLLKRAYQRLGRWLDLQG